MPSFARLSRWMALLHPNRGAFALCVGLLLAEAAAALSIPIFAGQLAQSFLVGNDALLGTAMLILLLVVLGQAALGVVGRYLQGAIAEDLIADLRLSVYERFLALPLSFHQHRPRGELLSLLSFDADAASNAAVHTGTAALPLAVLVLASTVMLVVIEPGLGAVAALALPLFVLFGRLVARRIRPVAALVHKLEADGSALAEAHLRMTMTAKAFGATEELTRYFDAHRARARMAGKRFAMVTALVEPGARVIGAFAILLVLWAASSGFVVKPLSIGDMVSFFLYGMLLTRPLGGLVSLYGECQQGLAAMQRIERVLGEPPEPSGDYAPPVGSVRGRLAVHELSFGYPNHPHLLRDVSFEVSPGEIVAVTGPNGIGKTTLLRLLMGYAQPHSGRILFDGVDLRQWDLIALRRCLSWVGHEVEFLPDSIRTNIALGAGVADPQRLRWALEVSMASEVVDRLPGGLEARLGPGGALLSSGQAQRLALARAVYKRSPVLLLDEPTSMFDRAGEVAFVRSARTHLDATTMVLVTHRRETLALADRVLRLDTIPEASAAEASKVIQGPWIRT